MRLYRWLFTWVLGARRLPAHGRRRSLGMWSILWVPVARRRRRRVYALTGWGY